jgi:Glycosyl transferase family 2
MAWRRGPSSVRDDAVALSLLAPDRVGQTARSLAVSGRLGLHGVVAASPWRGWDPRGHAARLVALAAMGDAEAASLAHRLGRYWMPPSWRRALAKDLAAFDARLALQVLGDDRSVAAHGLRLALCWRLGLREEFARLAAVPRSSRAPDLALLLASVEARPNQPAGVATVNALNLVLGSLGLVLLNDAVPAATLSVLALRASIPEAFVDGPRVSILMTTFHSADRVAHALRGLMGQTWRNLEIVVVDDASTDTTAEVVCSLAAQDARIKFIQLPQNVGTYAAKTIGYHHASGDFITCHDSDDWSHPQRIERQMAPLMRDPQMVATISSWVRITDDGQFYARGVYPLIRLNPASALFRRREVEARAGLWDAVRTGADSEFNARLPLVFGAKAIGRVKELLTFGAHREGSLMTASDTGYSAQGLSPARLAYTEAWTLWHIAELRAGRTPRMPDAREGVRPFELPAGARAVPVEAMQAALAGARVG